MDHSYLLTPILAWLAAGSLKFAINSIRTGQLAFSLIGYGGLPSTHSAVVGSTAALIALSEGMQHPAFGVAMTLLIIVIIDAGSLRRQVGQHAAHINQLRQALPGHEALRERMGHSRIEVAAGLVTGILVAVLVSHVAAITTS